VLFEEVQGVYEPVNEVTLQALFGHVVYKNWGIKSGIGQANFMSNS
jgi:hypothetical protein